jgi:hypothetical protein
MKQTLSSTHDRSRLLERAETTEGRDVLRDAWHLARDSRYAHLSNDELIRLAYWGASGAVPEENGTQRV